MWAGGGGGGGGGRGGEKVVCPHAVIVGGWVGDEFMNYFITPLGWHIPTADTFT